MNQVEKIAALLAQVADLRKAVDDAPADALLVTPGYGGIVPAVEVPVDRQALRVLFDALAAALTSAGVVVASQPTFDRATWVRSGRLSAADRASLAVWTAAGSAVADAAHDLVWAGVPAHGARQHGLDLSRRHPAWGWPENPFAVSDPL